MPTPASFDHTYSLSSSDGDGTSYDFQDDDFADDSEEFDDQLEQQQSSRSLGRDAFVAKTSSTKKTMNYWRIVMLLLIVVAGVGLSVAIYQVLSRHERAVYTTKYDELLKTMEDSAQAELQATHQAFQEIADAMTLYAASAGQEDASFPFLTFPLFETLANKTLGQQHHGGLQTIIYAPIVAASQRQEWEQYAQANQHQLLFATASDSSNIAVTTPQSDDSSVYTSIFKLEAPTTENDATATRVPEPTNSSSTYLPVWQVSPANSYLMNYNLLSASRLGEGLVRGAGAVGATERLVWTDFVKSPELFEVDNKKALSSDHDASLLAVPVYAPLAFNASEAPVAYLVGTLSWRLFLATLFPDAVPEVIVQVQNTCGSIRTYRLHEGAAADDASAASFNIHELPDAVDNDNGTWIPLSKSIRSIYESDADRTDSCEYSLVVYPTEAYENATRSDMPWTVTFMVIGVFSVLALAFVMYDLFIMRHNNVVLTAASKSQAILANLFPPNVRDRLFAEKETEKLTKLRSKQPQNLKTLMSSGLGEMEGEIDADMGYKGKPIADLFTEATILFADIAGFTAWSSQREPAQVFTLLETLYRAFDEIAARRRVFKVETIGDCYVAVTGVPEVQREHFLIMCRFARDMLNRCHVLTKRLETTLGPDTGDLDLRIGIHSGPVTAGVLRGERSRFQLFGDTMNTASRTESTGVRGKIQLSQETADLLIGLGKSHWLVQREDKVFAKGKGEMTTYWLLLNRSDAGSSSGDSDISKESRRYIMKEADSNTVVAQLASEKTARLVEWNCEVLARLLKAIAWKRMKSTSRRKGSVGGARYVRAGNLVIDEVKEVVALPAFDGKNADDIDFESIHLKPAIVDQLFEYVSNIASLYRANFFHSFEHGSHVTMSVTKLLSRIVTPTNAEESGREPTDHSFGITSDYLTQFSCIFSALIHDVDHTGLSNAQLVKEQTQIAIYYKNKSVAEQNSVDIAWHLLMDDSYADLRAAIYSTPEELERFRALVVNSVMATDIVDKELKVLRNERWNKAFSKQPSDEDPKTANDRKATIVIEHLIQASDVSHTMQHWHIYRKWNERFFLECYQSYCDGRTLNDPSESWHAGELAFFDYYIIPLAKKLKDCGVFGVSSDEYLNYAERNRVEWQARGHEVLAEMLKKAQRLMKPPGDVAKKQLLANRMMSIRRMASSPAVDTNVASLETGPPLVPPPVSTELVKSEIAQSGMPPLLPQVKESAKSDMVSPPVALPMRLAATDRPQLVKPKSSRALTTAATVATSCQASVKSDSLLGMLQTFPDTCESWSLATTTSSASLSPNTSSAFVRPVENKKSSDDSGDAMLFL